MKKNYILFLCLLLNQSCGDKGSSSNVVEINFEDSTVQSITQTSGVAESKFDKVINYFFSKAYAGGGNIKCANGSAVSLDVRMMNNDQIQFSTTCDSDLELKIRRKLLETLDGHNLIRIISGAQTGPDFNLDFTSGNFAFGVPFRVLEFKSFSPFPVSGNAYVYSCFGDYSFGFENGKVSMTTSTATKAINTTTNQTLKNAAVGTAFAGAIDDPANHNSELPSEINGVDQLGCSTNNVDVAARIDFRYKDGYLETDDSGLKRFSSKLCAKWGEDGSVIATNENGVLVGGSDINCDDQDFETTYERWCVDDNEDGTCD